MASVPSPTSYTSDSSGLPPYYCSLRFQEYVRPTPFGQSTFSDAIKYILPLPQTLADGITANWSSADLDVVGDIMNGGNPASKFAYKNIGTGVNAGVTGVFDTVGATLKGFNKSGSMGGLIDNITGAMSRGINAAVPAEAIQNAVEASNGIAPNPNPALIFKGPTLRDYSFRWVFYPENANKSVAIMNMISKIKSYSLPGLKLNKSSSFLQYPYMCMINFYPWDNKGDDTLSNGGYEDSIYGWSPNSIIKIKRCAVTKCDVTYNPGGTGSFFAGTRLPTVIELNLNLHELEYMTAEDWGTNLQSQLANNTTTGIGIASTAALNATGLGQLYADVAGGTPGSQQTGDYGLQSAGPGIQGVIGGK